ncbi:hypothetical protein ACTFIR_005737 [Dictyostelium discoideum]
MSIIRIQKSSTAELLMKSWEPSTLKVYSSSYTRFLNFCTSNSLNPANITLVVFMDYLAHLFKHKPPLAFSTINGHRSMLNQLLLLKNQTDIVNDPFITRIMTGIHKLRPSSAKYQEIWDVNQVFKHLSTIKVIPKYTYTALLKKTLVLCKISVRTTLETIPQEENELDWRVYSRILQCKSRPHQPSFRDESQIIAQSNQELQLVTKKRCVQSNPDGSVRILPEPSNEQLLNNQNECTPPRLESMEAMSGLPPSILLPSILEKMNLSSSNKVSIILIFPISNLVSDDSSSSSSSSSSHVSSSTGKIPRSIDQTINRVNTNPNSITLETGDYSTFQSHVMSIIRIQKSSTAELLMKSWEPSTLKVYSSSYTRFRNFCTLNSLNPSNITLVVFMDYLTHLFKHKPPLVIYYFFIDSTS